MTPNIDKNNQAGFPDEQTIQRNIDTTWLAINDKLDSMQSSQKRTSLLARTALLCAVSIAVLTFFYLSQQEKDKRPTPTKPSVEQVKQVPVA